MTRLDEAGTIANALADSYHFGPVTQPGVYETPEGDVYVVQPNQSKTRLYAKRWIRSDTTHAHLEYEAGAIYRLHPINRVSLERGMELSVGFGACCVCGAVLTDPKSVDRGIGPVCRKRFAR